MKKLIPFLFCGWYLIGPPRLPNGKLDETAPLFQWVTLGTYDNLNDCQVYENGLLAQDEEAKVSNFARLEAMLQDGLNRCIATDDPRLKEK